MIEPRKLPSGKWQARHEVNGKIRAAGTYATKREAEAVTQELNVEVRRGTFDDGTKGSMLFSDWAPVALSRLNVTPRTLYNYEGHARRELIPFFGNMKLRDISTDDVEDWWRGRTTKTRAAYITLSAILTKAVVSRKVESSIVVNPCRGANIGQDIRPERDHLEVDDFWRLVDAADDTMRTFILVTWGGSLRIGEALGLEAKHVNLARGLVTVSQQLTPDLELTLPKNGKTRKVALFKEAKDALRELPTAIGSTPLLRGAEGRRLSRPTLYKEWAKLRDEVGLPNLHIHDLRHLSLTLYAQSGATLKELMDRAGHSKPETVMIYQHLASDRNEQLVDKVAQLTSRVSAVGA